MSVVFKHVLLRVRITEANTHNKLLPPGHKFVGFFFLTSFVNRLKVDEARMLVTALKEVCLKKKYKFAEMWG